MKFKVLAFSLPAAVLLAFFAGRALSSPAAPKGQGKPSPEERKEMMKKMAQAMTPGKEHRFLDQFVGKWKVHVKIWMGGPGAPPMESDGRSEVKWVLDGHYIREDLWSKFPMPDPKDPSRTKTTDFHGVGFTGYDNFRRLYVGSWMDNMGTALLTMKGNRDRAGKVFTFYGDMDEPALGVFGRTVKYRNRILGKSKHVFESFDLYVGEDYKVMEITYTREE